MKQYRFTTQDLNYSTAPNCVLPADDPIHELLGSKPKSIITPELVKKFWPEEKKME